jgi:hypothetical protein
MMEITTQPLAISENEWQEILKTLEVRETWGLEEEDEITVEEFQKNVYGVKFKFVSGSPGYIGDLYILQGDVLTGDVPLMLGRKNGHLYSIY